MSLIFFLLFHFLKPTTKAVPVVKFDYVERLLQNKSDTTLVINFWATWCVPCVHELPAFDSVSDYFSNQKVSVILVSLDFISQYESRLKPFVEKNKIEQEVVLLNEPDYDTWINKVDPVWSGAIPATLILNGSNNYKKVYETEFTFHSLKEEVQKCIKTKP